MKEFEKLQKSENSMDNPTCELYEKVINSRSTPRYANKAEALTGTKKELNALAQKMGLSQEELLIRAEGSPVFKEEYVEALMLSRRIANFEK